MPLARFWPSESPKITVNAKKLAWQNNVVFILACILFTEFLLSISSTRASNYEKKELKKKENVNATVGRNEAILGTVTSTISTAGINICRQ